MDCSSTLEADEADLIWSDDQSPVSSDDDFSPHSSAPAEILFPGSTSRSPPQPSPPWMTDFVPATCQAQLGRDQHRQSLVTKLQDASEPLTEIQSSSSCTDSRDSSGIADRDDGDPDAHPDIAWEQCSDDSLTVPKVEPLEDDFVLESLQDECYLKLTVPALESAVASKEKRPRGRPRKVPANTAISTNKIAKGRTKTGCKTCRRRKKKCDEAKPRCMNCEKNAVVCEGYHEKRIWKSGRELAEEDRLQCDKPPLVTLRPIFHGVETTEDRIFWRHYFHNLSSVLTFDRGAHAIFKDNILQLAIRHQGLMHSILSVSGRHIDFDSPYGVQLLRDHPDTSVGIIQRRIRFHHEEAMNRLCQEMARPTDRADPNFGTILSARYAQMMFLVLQTRVEGNPLGEHRVHLQAYQKLIEEFPPDDPDFLSVMSEFFNYHIYADELIWHPDKPIKRLASCPLSHSSAYSGTPGNPVLASTTSKNQNPACISSVFDRLFHTLAGITTLRCAIRANMVLPARMGSDYNCYYEAFELDSSIRDWKPHDTAGEGWERLVLLYRQTMWVYLSSTLYTQPKIPGQMTFACMLGSARLFPINPTVLDRPGTSSSSPAVVARSSQDISSTQTAESSVNLVSSHTFSTPKTSVSPTTSVIGHVPMPPQLLPAKATEQTLFSIGRAPLSTSAENARPTSPQPVRRPPHTDPRITDAVDESLGLIELFKPFDPIQSLLLIPCLIIGTASFELAQRERVIAAVRVVRGYTGLKNCDRVVELLKEVWRLMDCGDWVNVWFWQEVAHREGLDFSCA